MNQETKTCQNCKKEFTIEPEDFKFYEKISVPPPTWCPECRMVRRMTWRNERTLYRRKCDLCNKDIVSIYSTDKKFKVYCRECYWSDKWDPLNYGIDYDFSKPFFVQFNILQAKVPRLYAMTTQDVNSPYANGSAYNKNCYLVIASDHNEDSAYLYSTFYCKDVFDCTGAHSCELSAWAVDCEKSYHLYKTQDSAASQNLYFCKNCVNCHDCVGCTNLRNKSYCIFNKQYSKEEYLSELEKLGLGSYVKEADIIQKSNKIAEGLPFKYIHGKNNVNVSGDYLTNSKKSSSAFDSQDLEDCKFINIGNKVKDSYDAWAIVDNVELNYENISHNSSKSKFTFAFWESHDGFYSDTCEGSNNLFASIGLRSKSYCILNRQYTKEEYEKLVPRIIKHMNDMPYIDAKGRVYKYGEFFPPELSPFSYNETIAQEYFPLTKEQALEQGYSWKDPEPRNYQITMKTEDIPDHIRDVKDSILNDIIQCAHHELGHSVSKCNEQCTQAFRIIPQELDFLRKQNLPIPRLCPNCRHYQRIKQRNPLKLWKRQCQCAGTRSENQVYTNTIAHKHGENHCDNNFETTYSPERKEIVYCESCYLKEVV